MSVKSASMTELRTFRPFATAAIAHAAFTCTCGRPLVAMQRIPPNQPFDHGKKRALPTALSLLACRSLFPESHNIGPKKGVVSFFPYFANAYENPVSTAWSAAKVLLRHFVSEKLGHEESLTAMKLDSGETKISWPNTPKHRCRSPLTSSIQNWFL